MRQRPMVVALLALSMVSAGCLGLFDDEDANQTQPRDPNASNQTTQDPPDPPGGYDVKIQRTSYGIPHITAQDWSSLGYGYGYAAANDYLCMIAEEYVTTAGERSKYFGANGTYSLTSNGQTYTNLESDLYFTLLDENPDLVDSIADNPDPRLQAGLDGYIDGYNRYLAETPTEERPADCRGEPWVKPITREDMVHRVNKLNLIASSGFFAPGMVSAQPPLSDVPSLPIPDTNKEHAQQITNHLPTPETLGIGSNGYAFGAEMTNNTHGMLLGNPHFPWQGPERFHQLHLTIPGEMDVMGMTLIGVPLVLIGFTEDFAWTHTVSTGWRFSLHQLQLVPGDPTRYIVDGETEAMTTRNVTVDTGNGEVSHTFYFSRYGPIIEQPLVEQQGQDVALQWDPDRAYALWDVNAHNNRTGKQFLEWNTADSFDEFKQDLNQVHGIPWVNTVAASSDGRAFYADVSVVPNFDDAKIEDCNTPIGQATMELARLPVFDGTRSECAPTTNASAAQEDIIPSDQMPQIETQDWLINSNDDYWLPNPEHRLEGYSPMIGWGPSERSMRTRMGYVLWEELEQGTDFHCTTNPNTTCDKLTLDRLQHALFASRLYTAETELDNITQGACTPPIAISSSGEPVDLTQACNVLNDWNREADLDSAGLPLFERFWLKTPKTWTTPFSEDDPVHTPRGFVSEDPQVRQALADAVLELQNAGLSLDVTAGEARSVTRNGETIPLHGAEGVLGSPSMLVVPFEEGEGFLEPVHGNSYIQTVTWADDGTPRAQALLTYSQSPHPDSPHYADQTRLYSEKEWVPLPFTQEEIEKDPNLETLRLETDPT